MARTLVKTLAGSIAQIQAKGLQLGDIKHSMLDLTTFQSVHGTSWILADGSSIIGSRLEALTGWTNSPDLRGVFLRGRDHGAGLNPDGDTAEGTYQADELGDHNHQVTYSSGSTAGTAGAVDYETRDSTANSQATSSTGGAETRPKNITVNFYIKINEE